MLSPRGAAMTLLVGSTLRASAALAAPSTASPAGPDKQACVDAATRGQIQRDDQKLMAAAEAFAVCASVTCPAAVRKSCTEWLEAVRSKMPTVMVRLAEAATSQLVIDGATGSFNVETTLDAGPHKLHVEAKGKPPLEQDFTLAPGDRRTIELRFPEAPPPLEVPTRPVPKSVWIVGGLAVAGLATWGVFGIMAKLETDRLGRDCAPRCTTDARDGAFRLAAVADVGLVVGALAALATGVLFVTRPTLMKPAAARGVTSAAIGPAGLVFP